MCNSLSLLLSGNKTCKNQPLNTDVGVFWGKMLSNDIKFITYMCIMYMKVISGNLKQININFQTFISFIAQIDGLLKLSRVLNKTYT